MACFTVPTTAAIVVTAIRKKIPAKYHVDWLLLMLWGGVLMLIVDHLHSGELVPYPPFLTAGIDAIIPEVLEVGVPMTIIVFLMWGLMVSVANRWDQKKEFAAEARSS